MAYIEMNSKMSFLIIEPDILNGEVLKRSLKKLGYSNFEISKNGYDAINYIKENNKVDYIISRYHMDYMNGIELFAELKDDYAIKRLPFTMFDEKLDPADLALLKEHEVDEFLTIPFTSKDLAEKITRTWSKYIDPKNVDFHFERARKYFLAHKYDEASKIFEQIEKAGRIQHRCKLGLAKIAFETKKVDESIALCSEVIKSHPNYVHALQTLGLFKLHINEYVGALEAFSKAIELSPKNPYRYEIVSELLVNMKFYKQAEEFLRLALKRELNFPKLEEAMAQVLIHLNKKEEAIKYFEILVTKNPNSSKYLNNIAICYKSLNDINKAIQYYHLAIAKSPEDARIKYNLAITYILKEKKNESIKYLKEVLLLEPNFEKARLKLLQLESPELYKEEMIRLKEHAEKSSEEQTSSAPLIDDSDSKNKSISVSEKTRIHKALKKTFAVTEDKKRKVQEFNLSPQEIERIEKMTELTTKFYYLNAKKNMRKQYFDLIEEWFKSIQQISEEITTNILELSQGLLNSKNPEIDLTSLTSESSKNILEKFKKISKTNKNMEDDIMPFMSSLQIQDYIRQAYEVIYNGYQLTLNSKESKDTVMQKIGALNISKEQSRVFNKIVLNKEITEEPEDNTNNEDSFFF